MSLNRTKTTANKSRTTPAQAPAMDPAKKDAIEFEFNYYWYDCHSFQSGKLFGLEILSCDFSAFSYVTCSHSCPKRGGKEIESDNGFIFWWIRWMKRNNWSSVRSAIFISFWFVADCWVEMSRTSWVCRGKSISKKTQNRSQSRWGEWKQQRHK